MRSRGFSGWVALGGAICTVYYLFFVLMSENFGTDHTVWALSFGVGVLLPLFVRTTEDDARSFASAWALVGGVLGLFTLIESIIGFVPVYGSIYSILGIESIQHWDSYRAEGTFGHPLYAGTFLGVGALAALMLWMRNKRPIFLGAAAASAVGMASTVSRGAFVALGVGLVLAFVLTLGARRTRMPANIAAWMLFLTSLSIAVLSGSLLDRLNSSDAESSDVVRQGVYTAAMEVVADSGGMPNGLGTSGEAIAKYNPQGFPLESAFWQLMVGFGVYGTIVFLAVVLAAILVAIRRETGFFIAPMLVCFCLSVSSYNMLDELRTFHPLLGLLVAMCLTGAPRRAPQVRVPNSVGRAPRAQAVVS
ncbi:hypothetical protein [Actinomycetospora corticicola]|uniref:O-antigen ligase n=2 Tax=Actinomycetospora corticicola TaxID=663602 RepID=A0A7Y9J453_9PSEU|nr:hypothetical protein [Actinomycetospora corticicola]NYD34551.1 O-antigen ligase [Actinomycetospora corticicola]